MHVRHSDTIIWSGVLTVEDTLQPPNPTHPLYAAPPIHNSHLRIALWAPSSSGTNPTPYSTSFRGQLLTRSEMLAGKFDPRKGVALDPQWEWCAPDTFAVLDTPGTVNSNANIEPGSRGTLDSHSHTLNSNANVEPGSRRTKSEPKGMLYALRFLAPVPARLFAGYEYRVFSAGAEVEFGFGDESLRERGESLRERGLGPVREVSSEVEVHLESLSRERHMRVRKPRTGAA